MLIRITVWPKKNEKGAFQVLIIGDDYPKTPYKFFLGEKIFCAQRRRFGRIYGRICYLISEAHRTREEVTWENPVLRGARHHEWRARAAKAVEHVEEKSLPGQEDLDLPDFLPEKASDFEAFCSSQVRYRLTTSGHNYRLKPQ